MMDLGLFDMIKQGYGLRIQEMPLKTQRWVSEGLRDELEDWYIGKKTGNFGPIFERINADMQGRFHVHRWPVLIQPPTGTGKNYFIINDVSNIIKRMWPGDHRVLILTIEPLL